MNSPSACPDCLRRSWLLATLAPYIERVLCGAPGGRFKLFALSNEDLVRLVAPEVSAHVLSRIEALPTEHFSEELERAKCWACCRHDEQFPESLAGIESAPTALFGRGDPLLLSALAPQRAVAVVGERRATIYGRESARSLGHDLGEAGLLVLSGLGFGIDGCAHRGALDTGRTVAVVGCGPDIAYPTSHRTLWRRIAENGAVVSELPPGTTPWRWTFPARNRILAALAGMTVVVEAAERSGSLLTADLAAEFGRDLGAVPGPVTSRASAGPNALLASGACVIRDAQDVLDALLSPVGP